MKTLRILYLFALTALPLSPAYSQGAPPLDLSATLPVDPKIIIGTLDNGLRYYIRENRKPENRAELRLAVNAGSVLEDDDQRGLAHFVEHMAFNGTKNFAKHEIVDFLESIGMRFGADVNAYTSFDETVYMLQVPTDTAGIVEKGFQILEEWAHNVSFDADEIDKERGVVIEERRLGRGAGARMFDKQLPVLLKDSRYAERLPIGLKEVLENAPREAIVRFYEDWYRPDLMAVVAVGDFDKNVIEEMIRSRFSKIAGSQKRKPRESFPVPDHQEALFSLASDVEATGSSISIYYKNDVPEQGTVGTYRKSRIGSLFNTMLNNRLNELLQKPEPPFLYGYVSKGQIIRTKDFFIMAAAVQDNGLEAGLEAVLTEARRVSLHGFTQTELDREKAEMLSSIERIYNERDKSQSSQYAAEYLRNFLTGESLPGIEYEYALYNTLIPGIELSELDHLADEWIENASRVMLVNLPEKDEIVPPSEKKLLAVFDTVNQKKIDAYEDSVPDVPLVENAPNAGSITETVPIEELGVTEWQLSNGVKVILKPTDFKNDQILFTSFSPGGNSLVSDSNYVAAITATSLIRQGGLGMFDRVALQKKLAGKLVSVSPFINTRDEGLAGSSTPKDVETLFELIYLNFTAPRKDDDTFQSYQSRILSIIKNRHADPNSAYRDTITVTMSNHHFRTRPWSEAVLSEMDLEKSFRVYQDRFADASDFTFLFVGNLDMEKMKPLVETYLGGLPSFNRKESGKDVGITHPKGVVEKTVAKGKEAKSRVTLLFTGPFDWHRKNNHKIQSMASVLEIKLREVMREDMGGTYGVGVRASTSRYPSGEYNLTISFGCAPERVDELTSAVFVQLDSLKSFGTTEKNLTKVKETQRRKRETDLKENGFWLSALRGAYYHGLEPIDILTYNERVAALSLQDVQQAAQAYFNTENYAKIILMPEESRE